MVGVRRAADAARAEVSDALADGRRRAGGVRARTAAGSTAMLGLQRAAGNAAVNALMAARLRFPGGQAVSQIDSALREIKRDEPAVDVLETGLKAAKATGVPVDLEGLRPPPSALAVTTTGFGPEAVAAKKAVPPPKPVPKVSPLGKAAARSAKVAGKAGGAPPAVVEEETAPAAPAPQPLSADRLLEPPVAPSGVQPAQDPAFTRVTGNVKRFAKAKRQHPTAASKAKEAQDAALAPNDDLTGQAKASKVDTMDAQRAGSFDKKAFIAAVKAAIEAKSPKTLKEADNYAKSGKAGEVKGAVKGLVTQGKQGQSKDIETATAAAPDVSKAVPKPVTPMQPEQAGSAVAIPAGGAVPKPAPPEQLNLEAGKHQANQELAEGEVTEEQLAQSNEPQFEQALADKQEAAKHADTAPGEFREHEKQVIEQNKADAAAETKTGVAGMQATKGAALAALVTQKGKTKSKDETRRAEVTAKVQAIFATTEAEVKKILDGIDPKVEKAFETGEKVARQAFETYVSAKMSAYKKDRYGGWTGKFRWLRDKIKGMPAKVNEFYVAGREIYLQKMDGVISDVAEIVGRDLTAAKTRIATGQTEISSYVKSLPKDLQRVGSQASKEIAEKFSELESEVDSKQESVVDTLATKYTEARKGLDERIEELQAENRGLIDKAIGAIKAVINTIRQLAAMLRDVLARVAGVVGSIISAPVRFLGNLIAGVKGGILKFKDNFVDHLRKGLLGWLFGALAEGGVEIPDKFDLKGVVKLLASIFGLTWTNIRNRLVKQIGEKAMAAAEQGVEIFQLIRTEGVAGLWQKLIEKIGDIKEMILEKVKDFVVTKIIVAGITWLISLLNPAAAFIKACKLIYDVVMFFVNNIERIGKFVNTIIDSVADMVRGNVSAVVNKIDDVLGQMVPIIIGFLANVIGLGGIGEKIRGIVKKLQKPVNQALDFVIKTGLKLAGPIIRGIKGISGKVKAKVAAGKAWAKGKAEAGKAYVKGRVEAGKQWAEGKLGLAPSADKRTHDQKRSALLQASQAAYALLLGKGATQQSVEAGLPKIKKSFGLTDVRLVPAGPGTFRAHLAINPEGDTEAVPLGPKTPLEEAKTFLGKKFLVRSTSRVATVETVLDGGAVILKYDLERGLPGPAYRQDVKSNELRPSFKLATFLANVPDGGAELIPAEGGPNQTQYTLDGRTLRPGEYHQVRKTFYEKGIEKTEWNALIGVKLAEVLNPDRQTFRCPGFRIPAHDAPLRTKEDGAFYALDHMGSVAEHWNNTGHKVPHRDRLEFYMNPDNLRILCQKCNGAKSSRKDEGDDPPEKYRKEVEIPRFTGPDGKV
ncbi:MAG: hypothetical protein ACRDP9_08385 [Kribbellaceae bacterium]